MSPNDQHQLGSGQRTVYPKLLSATPPHDGSVTYPKPPHPRGTKSIYPKLLSIAASKQQTEANAKSRTLPKPPGIRVKFAALGTTILAHGIIVALLAWVVLKVPDEEFPELAIETAPTEKLNPVIEKKFPPNRRPRPPSSTSQATMVLSSAAISPVVLQSIEIGTKDLEFGLASGKGDFGAGLFPGAGDGESGIPGMLKGRCDQTERIKRLRENGGKAEYDERVVKALDYLKKEQNRDGSWGQTFPVSMTALAILAYSGHCETVDSPEYGETLVAAIDYLCEIAEEHHSYFGKPAHLLAYDHAIATYALAEAYSINRNARAETEHIANTLRNVVPIIIEGQTSEGSWRYGYALNGVGDLSISGWNIQALKAAKLTGIEFVGQDKAMDKVMKKARDYIDTTYRRRRGYYCYNVKQYGRGKLSLTGVGVLCARMLGEAHEHEKKSIDSILTYKPASLRRADPYAMYYHSLACFQVGGEVWDRYNQTNQKLIVDSQKSDGSWPVGAGNVTALAGDEKLYHTCLCTLMLEVYYRYLPATDRAGE